jgi:hypothetical protein
MMSGIRVPLSVPGALVERNWYGVENIIEGPSGAYANAVMSLQGVFGTAKGSWGAAHLCWQD